MQFPRLNLKQLDRLSEIFGNLGLLILASMVFPIFTDSGEMESMVVSAGLVLFALCSLESLFLVGGDKNE